MWLSGVPRVGKTTLARSLTGIEDLKISCWRPCRRCPPPVVNFWRDKRQREVDFVLPRGRGEGDAIECKWTASAFDLKGLEALRVLHPTGRNFVVTPDPRPAYTRRLGELEVTFIGLGELPALLA